MRKTPLPIPLADDSSDVIRKAMLGNNFTPKSLAQQANLPLKTIQKALSYPTSDLDIPSEDWEKLASLLHLNAKTLQALTHYSPKATLPRELSLVISPFYETGSNAYILTHGKSATIFDTGTDASLLHDYVETHNLEIDAIYITHAHHDHIAGIDTFEETPLFYAQDLLHGEERRLAPHLTLTALETNGHFTPSRAYFIQGLSSPLCICGDILFAGSLGKTPNPKNYQQSLYNLKHHILTLPPQTLLCSGHGPISTVEQELHNNPFLSSAEVLHTI